MGKDLLAGEPFRLTVGSPAAVAAPEHKAHNHQSVILPALAVIYDHIDSENVQTGSAGVTALGCDIPKLLNQRAQEFAGLQSVLAGPLSTARVWCIM